MWDFWEEKAMVGAFRGLQREIRLSPKSNEMKSLSLILGKQSAKIENPMIKRINIPTKYLFIVMPQSWILSWRALIIINATKTKLMKRIWRILSKNLEFSANVRKQVSIPQAKYPAPNHMMFPFGRIPVTRIFIPKTVNIVRQISASGRKIQLPKIFIKRVDWSSNSE